MQQTEYVGYFILAAVVVVGLFMTIGAPIIKLNKIITQLSILVENLTKDLEKQIERITRHGSEIGNLERRMTILEERIKHLGAS